MFPARAGAWDIRTCSSCGLPFDLRGFPSPFLAPSDLHHTPTQMARLAVPADDIADLAYTDGLGKRRQQQRTRGLARRAAVAVLGYPDLVLKVPDAAAERWGAAGFTRLCDGVERVRVGLVGVDVIAGVNHFLASLHVW